ncbi:sodium-dependent transporter [Phoenicibacter congonensis]|uniref:sodium-dependent transporter n=1 Tax=Phoenicibacter congonensis TaxID=1944646 RepID=UPI0009A7B026|nr:sodium-dependent transporter [Phoenicibacter congonensis]
MTVDRGEDLTARSSWTGKAAFVLAAAASAVGLGNIWRFPYLAAKYGGGTFLLVYVLLLFTFGVSLLLLETALGRKTGKSAIAAFKAYGKKYAFIGVLASAVPFIITCYYCVIGGWVTKYAATYLSGGGHILAADAAGAFISFITSPVESFAWAFLFVGCVVLIVALGVEKGIEKSNLVMMPLLVVIAIGIAIFSIMQPGANEGALYYLVPDLSKISPELLIAALGQLFYSMSLAMGIMITYGSYAKKNSSLTSSTVQIAGFDFGISFFAGLMIIPAAFAGLGGGDAIAAKAGPSLMFITLPEVFDKMGSFGGIIGALFFVLVFFAALTSAISLTETLVSIICDATGCKRKKAIISVIIYFAITVTLVNLGYNKLGFIQPLGEGTSLLDFFDFLSNTVMMPIVAILTCVFVGWVIKPKEIIDEVRISSKFRLAGAWSVMIKYVCPILIAVILISYTAAQFGVITI